jgi:hypothetical protein
VLEGAINDDANIRQFVDQYKPTFPVGLAGRLSAMEYMQMSPMVRSYVPYMAFVDRKGVIRAQYTGGDAFLSDEARQPQNIRDEALKLLAEDAAPNPLRTKRLVTKK